MSIAQDRVLGWDILRGLCAMSVMVYHLLYWQDLATVSTLGTYGVYLFFILSGASLAYVYDTQAIGTLSGFAAFLAVRWLRLAPLYVAVCALFLLMLATRNGQWVPGGAGLLALNASFLFGAFTPAVTALGIGGWSLGIEFMFYLAMPLVVRVLPLATWRLPLLALLVVVQWTWIDRTVGALGLASASHAYHQVPAFAAYFFVGCLIGRARRHPGLALPLHWGLLAWGAMALLLLALAPAVSGDELVGWRGVLLPLACVALVWASGRVVVPGRARALAQWLGDITYGTYLLHPMLFFGFAWFVLPLWTPSSVESLPLGARVVILAAGVTLSCLFAAASERHFERPVRAVGRRVLAKWLPPRQPQSDSASIAS
ncbi:MAG: acyltransferase family protein [Ramlibacter sp.]